MLQVSDGQNVEPRENTRSSCFLRADTYSSSSGSVISFSQSNAIIGFFRSARPNTNYPVLYFETTVTRRPRQPFVNLILIETKKDHFLPGTLKNGFFRVLRAILVMRG